MPSTVPKYKRKFVLVEVLTSLTNRELKNSFLDIKDARVIQVFVNDSTEKKTPTPNIRRSII